MRISWSAFQMFHQCAKRYAYKNIDKKPEPPQPHFEHGNRIHSDIEHALKKVFHEDKPPFPPVSHVNWAVELVEGEQPSKVQVEEWVKLSRDGIDISGKADCIIETENGVAVIDWKTSKRPPGELKPDVKDQLHLYGAMLGLSDKDRVVAAYPEHRQMFPVGYSQEHGETILNRVVETGHVLEEFVSIIKSAEEVKGNTQFLCQWCSYRNECPDSYRNKES